MTPGAALKPTIALRKNDEREFVNARTYWSLQLDVVADETFELRVRYDAVDTAFSFWSLARAERDDVELLSAADHAERLFDVAVNEPVDCPACAWATPEQRNAQVENGPTEPDGWYCAECRRLSFARAETALADRARVVTAAEERVRELLVERWRAFRVLFNPAVNF